MDELWGINVKIINNTEYNITVTTPSNDSISVWPASSAEWTDVNKNSLSTTDFSTSAVTSYMTGSFLWNSTDGMVVNRGNLVNQDIAVEIYVNGIVEVNETQATNGAVTVCDWDDFIDGGNLTLTFNNLV